MHFGICTSVETAPAAKAAGWDYIEPSVQGLLQGTVSDDQWKGPERAQRCPLPMPCANLLVPAPLKITGPEANLDALKRYLETVTRRAAEIGIRTLVFGSGGARQVPDGFDRATAEDQILAFARACGEIAARHDVTIVAEPLNRQECNILNTVQESLGCVKKVNHPNFQLLVDSYHFWLEDEPLKHLAESMPWIKHVHVADKVGRVPPGESGQSDYRPLFHVLKQGHYDGNISVEGDFPEAVIREKGAQILNYLKTQWLEA